MATVNRWTLWGLAMVLAMAANSGRADTSTPTDADLANTSLLESISSQAPTVSDPCALQEAMQFAEATQVWIEQDLILRSWPTYADARDTLRQELSQAMNLEKASVAELRSEAARLRGLFWYEEGPLKADGYRKPYKARALLEIARQREPANLAVCDDLVETILTTHPLTCYDPEKKGCFQNVEVVLALRALRSENYAQVVREIEEGRRFTWEDFARVADFVQLWSAQDPQQAAEAFKWGLSQAGPSLKGSDYEKYAAKILAAIESGHRVGFGIYMRLRVRYPHDHLYGRRLPSFRGPDPAGKGLVRMLGVGDQPAEIPFGS